MNDNFHTKSKRQVLLVIRHPIGGIKSYIKYVYKSPWFDNHSFTVILPKGGQMPNLFSTDKSIDVEYIQCKDTTRSITLTIFKTLRKNRYDLVHSHGFTSAICTAIATSLYSVPHIMTSHDMLLAKQFYGFKGKLKKILLPIFLNRAERIHSVSHDAEKNLVDVLPTLHRKKLLTIPNGIDISQYENIQERNIRSEMAISKNVLLIGFLGRYMSPKGFQYLIEAIDILNRQSELPRKPLVVAFGYGGFIREDREIIAAKGLENSFLFLPGVDDVASTLRGLDVVAMPSLWESCGLLAMEALVSGVPLIASSCIGLREVTAGTPTFVVEPKDSQSLAQAIRDCIFDNRNYEFKEYISEAKKRFNADSTSKQLRQLYNEVAIEANV
ncbi:glycosyltransferase involved in cell wall biosynthesis [Methylohalomonas lacus]|uniref:Glycosyltransferase involved in cell wall biosynthesis n=1 Tax=Methylohalomonas lacus TaxID=398773 RepID=A0AAE3HM34_9GAMM|nr:glycosyltransferase family 4 protein [Methylohalomonas lacus]MCS3904325.1 glycosyltransferase involved in cell wall biosynthesis [Methylohalomonas lacus]